MRKVLWILFLFCVRAEAGEIVFKNGDRLTGKISEVTDSHVVLETEMLGKLSIPKAAIERMKQDEAPVAAQQLVATAPKPDPVPQQRFKLWGGSVDAAISATHGNADTRTVNFGFRTARVSQGNKLSLYATSIFSKSSTDSRTIIADAIRGGSRYEVNFSRRFFTFGFTDLEHDQFQGLESRAVGGGGIGLNVIKNSRTTLQVFSGGSANREKFRNRLARQSREFVAGYDVSHRLNSVTSVNESLMVYPNLSSRGQYRVTFDSSIVTRLNSWLAWHVTSSSRYTNNPADGKKKHDLLMTTGIRFVYRGERVQNIEARPELRRR
jgi:putative salt-induced outer membrane protein YdiY